MTSATVLALLLCVQAPSAGAARTEAPLAPLVAELETLRAGAGAADVARRIRAIGADAPHMVLAAWSRDELPGSAGALVLGDEERHALLLGARALGRSAFITPWSEAAGSEDARLRRATIELVGELGEAGDLPLALRAAARAGNREAPEHADALALERAATALLVRDPRTLTALRPAILGTHPELASGLIRAAGSIADVRTLTFLEELLGMEPRLDLPLLSQMERVARTCTPPFEERHGARVRAYLADPDRQLARSAALCLAVLQDDGSLEALVELSASGDPALAAAAFVALERTTGLPLPRSSERWRCWVMSERTWQREHGARLDAALASRSVPRLLSALREYTAHRVGRVRTADMIAPLLEHPDPRVRAQACRTLGALGVTGTAERLEQALDDDDPEVVEAARAAVRG
jgi:hypothetical protein